MGENIVESNIAYLISSVSKSVLRTLRLAILNLRFIKKPIIKYSGYTFSLQCRIAQIFPQSLLKSQTEV